MRNPDFRNLLRVLDRQAPERSTLFEFFLNGPLYEQLAGEKAPAAGDLAVTARFLVKAFHGAGYDYASLPGSTFGFPAGPAESLKSRSLNEGAVITDRASFNRYPWQDPDRLDYSSLQPEALRLPPGMKAIVYGPGGVLENVISLMGYEALCYLVMDDPKLAGDVFDAVGARLVRHYVNAGRYETVGAMISNDDWGFKTQTMLAPEDMRRYVFPWHRRIVKAIHDAGRPAILHSCGQASEIIDDIIDDMKYDGKHSYEDTILPVEEAYERWGRRIAVLGGIDVDFICRHGPDEVYRRSQAMLQRARARGSYALGSGNSIPEFVPQPGYFAMTRAALEG